MANLDNRVHARLPARRMRNAKHSLSRVHDLQYGGDRSHLFQGSWVFRRLSIQRVTGRDCRAALSDARPRRWCHGHSPCLGLLTGGDDCRASAGLIDSRAVLYQVPTSLDHPEMFGGLIDFPWRAAAFLRSRPAWEIPLQRWCRARSGQLLLSGEPDRGNHFLAAVRLVCFMRDVRFTFNCGKRTSPGHFENNQ